MRKWMYAVLPASALLAVALAAPVAGAAGACPPGTTNPAYCPAPVVTTQAADNVTATSATLHGTINDQGDAAQYLFQYGVTTAYASATPTQTLAASTATQSVSAAITGLTPGTTYHFRLVAANANLPSQGGIGQDMTFTTPKAQPRLTIKATPRRDRHAPFRYRVSGKLRPPSGVSGGCSGSVSIKFHRPGHGTVASATATVKSNCQYSKSVTVSQSPLARRGTLTVTGHFGGNSVLTSASNSTSVRYG
jgi:hypothetical protein